MESSEFDELVGSAQQVGKLLAALLDGIAEEDVDLGRVLRQYPVWTIAFAAGAGAVAGWWFGRRGGPSAAPLQPPPVTEPERSVLEDAGSKLLERAEEFIETHPQAREYLDILLPEGVEPGMVVEEVTAAARSWVDTVLEPKLREGLDQVSENVSRAKFGDFLRQARKYVEMDDPDDPRHQDG